MQYNTQQKRMPLPEYGRSIQNMVDYALTIQDRAERQRCANTIINIMGNMFPICVMYPISSISFGTTWPSCPVLSWILTIRMKLSAKDNLVTRRTDPLLHCPYALSPLRTHTGSADQESNREFPKETTREI